MSVVDLKSISGITSITTPASDNQLTLHTNNTTERLRIASDGKVGIGTAVPTDFVDIMQGSDDHNIVVIRGADDISEYAGVGVQGGNAIFTGGGVNSTSTGIVFRTAASGVETERIRIESTGRVGINTTSARVNGVHIYDKHLALDQGYPITWLQPNSSSSRGRMTVDSGGNYLFQFGSGNDEKIRFKSDGKVGVGTAAPQEKLHLYGGNCALEVDAPANRYCAVGFSVEGASKWWMGRGDSDILSETSFFIGKDAGSAVDKGGNSAKLVIDSSGYVLAGHTTRDANIAHGTAGRMQLWGTSWANAGIALINTQASTDPAFLSFAKSRKASATASAAAVQSGDRLGEIRFAGDDGTDMHSFGASIAAYAQGTIAGNRMPGKLVFATTSDAANAVSSSTRMVLYPSGQIDLGTGVVNIASFCKTGNNHQIVGQAADDVAALDVYSQHGNDADKLSFAVSDNRTGSKSNAFVVRGNGKIGINETNPGANLHVEQDNAHSSTYYLNSDAAILIQNKNSTSTSKTVLKLEGPNSSPSDCAIVYGAGSSTLIFADRQNERMRITSDGLVKWAGHTLSARNSATGVAGGMIYNTDAKVFQYYDGSGWQTITSNSQIVATGGNTVSTSNGYRIHDFVGSSTFEITSGVGEVEILVVGGGGSEGGGNAGCHGGGGGGGGGVVYQKRILYPGKYAVTVGAGGLWRNNGASSKFGNNWSHSTITAYGGGAGGPTLSGNGNDGGSGGGGSRHDTSNQGGSSTQPIGPDGGFGNAGGNTGSNTSPGGGGGAGGAGATGDAGGVGGAGKQFTQFGLNTYFGAGGNGNSTGGSAGQTQGSNNGAANTGAGAGGSAGTGTRYSGGSGRVMLRYPAAS